MGAKRAYRRYTKKAKLGAKNLAKKRSKAKTVGKRIEDDVRRLEKAAVSEVRKIERGAVKGARSAEKKAVKEIRHIGKDLTLFCDNCGKAMRPGGHVSRMFGGRELRFCSALCSAKYRPDM
jgi:hypothetical protein